MEDIEMAAGTDGMVPLLCFCDEFFNCMHTQKLL
jgi:hypothetical protein